MRYILIGLLLLVIAVSCNSSANAIPAHSSNTTTLSDSIISEQVCMVNNKFMGEKQIPILIDGITYYGCCKMCEEQLKEDAEVRFSIDPVSGNKVNKALAFIAVTGEDGAVTYFENKTNYINYKSVPKN